MELKVVNHYATLSAAIRAGAKLAPQTTEAAISRAGKTCALGAGIHALLGSLPKGNFQMYYKLAKEVYPYIDVRTAGVDCPACHEILSRVQLLVFHLNDYHNWTRERIADWLEEWENEHLGYETITEEVTTSEPPATLLLQQEAALQG